jgi:hypothetical protein
MNETNRPLSLGQRIAAWVGLSAASSTRAGSQDTRARVPRAAPTGFPEPVGPAPHHNDPELVIPTIEAELQPLARELLAAGFAVIEAWGPVQMACAGLLLERDGTQVLFDAERGMTSARLIRSDRDVWLGVAVAAWARSSNGDGEQNVPGFTPWSLISLFAWEQREYRKAGSQQQTRYGSAVCDWFAHADLGAIDAVEAERRALDASSRSIARPTPEQTAEVVAARYADALDRYFTGHNGTDAQPPTDQAMPAADEPITSESIRTSSFVRVIPDWKSFALWLAGRVGTDNVDGRALGLSDALIEDLDRWALDYDAGYNDDDPRLSTAPDGHLARGYELAKRVRAELGPEWIVTAKSPDTRREVRIDPLHGSRVSISE